VKRISGENMLNLTEFGKAEVITKAFNDAYKSALSMIILDDLERLRQLAERLDRGVGHPVGPAVVGRGSGHGEGMPRHGYGQTAGERGAGAVWRGVQGRHG